MRVTIVVTILDMSGGVRVIRDHAEYLAARGHDVTIVEHSLPKVPLRTRIRRAVRNLRTGAGSGQRPTFPIDPRVSIKRIDIHEAGWEQAFPDADVVVATWWLSCEHVARLPESKGRKVHFAQGHEVFEGQPADRVADSIRLIPTKIAVSSWVAEVMREEYGFDEVYTALNGIDTGLFRAPSRAPNRPAVVGTVYSENPCKNSAMAVEAFHLARRALPDLSLLVFGSAPPPPELRDRDWATYHYLPPFESIPSLYASCDAWLFTSTSEGFGLPVLEALACGTPVIATRAGAAPDLVSPDNGALVDGNPEAMAAEIVRICTLDPERWQALSRNAAATAAEHRLECSGAAFEAALAAVVAGR